jgi:hypothetical protein
MAVTLTISPAPVVFNQDPMFLQFSTSETTQVNHSGYVQIYATYDDENNATEYFIVELEPSFDPNHLATLNLANLIGLETATPSNNTIGNASITVGELGRSSGQIQARFGEAYGHPKIIQEPLSLSAWISVVRGGTEYWQGFSGIESQSVYLLNSLRTFRNKKEEIVKEIYHDQPEYVSFYAKAASTVVMTATIQLRDGTTQTMLLPDASISKGCSYVGISPDQIGILAAHPTAVKYRVLFFSGVLLGYITYSLLQNEPENNIYLLMETGTGGVETIKVAGKNQYSAEVSYNQHERAVWLGTNHTHGTISHSNKRGQKIIKCNSGFYSREYCDHLEQLLYGKVWLIDKVRKKFLAYNVTDTSLKTSDDDDELYYIEFTIEQAWKSTSHNTFNQ